MQKQSELGFGVCFVELLSEYKDYRIAFVIEEGTFTAYVYHRPDQYAKYFKRARIEITSEKQIAIMDQLDNLVWRPDPEPEDGQIDLPLDQAA